MQAPARIARETPSQQATNADRNGRGETAPVGLLLHDRAQRLGDRRSAEGGMPGQHLVEQAAERPHVGASVHAAASHLLRAHAGRRARDTAGRTTRARVVTGAAAGRRAHQVRQAEVEHLHVASRGQLHVGGLEIAVNDALLVRRLQRVRDLAGDGQCLVRRQRSSSQPIGERRPLDQLHDDGQHVSGPLQAVDRADARVRERRQDARFLLQPCRPGRVAGPRRRQHFHRDLAVQLGVERAIDLAHAAGTERTHDAIRSDLASRVERGPVGRVRRRRQDRHRGALRERSRRLVGGEQRLDVGVEPAVVPARLLDERRPRLGWLLQRRVEDRLDARPAVALVRDRHAPRPSVRRRIQPGPRRAPFAGDRRARQRQHRRDLVFRQPAEVLQLDDPCLALVELRQRGQCVVEHQHLALDRRGGSQALVERHAHAAGTFRGGARAGVIDQDPPHHARAHGEELGAVAPRRPLLPHQAQVGFVDEGGRLQRVIAALARGGTPPRAVAARRRRAGRDRPVPAGPPRSTPGATD